MDKEAKDIADAAAEKKQERLMKVQNNIKSNAMDLTEKARAINQKQRKNQKKVESSV
jgi:hypothetical protein